VTPDLFVERIEQLLSGSCAREGSAVKERSAKAAKIEQAFRSAVEGHAHAIEQVNDAGRSLAHGFDRGLVGKEVAAVDGVIKVLRSGIALALQVLGGIDAALGADRVRAFYGDDGKQVHVPAHFGDLDDSGESRQSTANHDNLRGSCHSVETLCLQRIELSMVETAGGHGCCGAVRNEYMVMPPTPMNTSAITKQT